MESADVDAITDATIAAFETLEISSHTEPFIVAALPLDPAWARP